MKRFYHFSAFSTAVFLVVVIMSSGAQAQTLSLVYPAGGDSLYKCNIPDTIHFSWSFEPSSADSFHVIFFNGSGAFSGGTVIDSVTSLTDTIYTKSFTLGSSANYSWAVRAFYSSGTQLLSEGNFFVRPEKIYLVKPYNGAIGQITHPTLSWYASCLNGTIIYSLIYSTDQNFSVSTVITTSSTSDSITANLGPYTYYWKVVAEIDTSPSNANPNIFAYSDVYNFKVGLYWNNAGSVAQGHIIWDITGNSTYLFAGTWGGGIYRSPVSGVDWSRADTNLVAAYVWSLGLSNSGDTLFAATEKGIHRSADSGVTWTPLPLMLGASPYYPDVRSIAVDPNNSANLIAAVWGAGVYKSTNKGNTWFPLNGGLTNQNTLAVAIDSSGTKYYTGTADGGVFRIVLPSAIWLSLPTMSFRYIWTLEAGKTGLPGRSNSSHIYAGTYGGGFYRSTDNGLSWNSSNMNLPNKWVYGVYVDDDGNVIVSNWPGGISMSTNGGQTWEYFGLTQYLGADKPESDIYISAIYSTANRTLIVGTKDGRFFRTVTGNPITGVNSGSKFENVNSIDDFILMQNYPNPFNPTTQISFSLPRREFINLSVYDILGCRVKTLVNEDKSAGNYTIIWHGDNDEGQTAASGIYIYQIKFGSGVKSKKMILQR